MQLVKYGLMIAFLFNAKVTSSQPYLLIDNVNIIPMTHETVIPNASILIEGDRIAAIGRSGSLEALSVEVIDGKGQYVIPGLIEMHVHIREKDIMGEYLKYGFTTLRNMNGNFGDPLKWKEEIASDQPETPDLITASPTIIGERHEKVIRPGYPYAIHSTEEARQMVRKFKEDGYDLIKIFRLEKEPFYALIEEAQKLQIPVAGHLPDVNLDGDSISYTDLTVEQILQTGMGIEHVAEFTKASFYDDKSDLRMEYIIGLLKDNDVTLSTLIGNDYRHYMLKTIRESYLSDSVLSLTRSHFGEEGIDQLKSIIKDQPDVDIGPGNELGFVLSALKRFNDRGVNIVIGTDSHLSPLNIAGLSSLQELEFLTQAGFSNYESLKTVTVNAAKALGRSGDRGTIEIGKRADLVLFESNPLEDLRTLYSPTGVFLRGNWIDASGLEIVRSD